MSTAALALVVLAALAHAAWNVLAKTAGGGATFVWLFSALAAAIWLPVAAIALIVDPHRPSGSRASRSWPAAGHCTRSTSRCCSAATGDLSLVYPLARGTGPLLSTLAALVIFAERPSARAPERARAGWRGDHRRGRPLAHRSGRWHANGGGGPPAGGHLRVLTGAAIASYTLWDKQAVGPLGIEPVVYYWGANVAETALLTALVAHRRAEVRSTWGAYRRQAIGVAVLSPLAYVLVLLALAHAPVSYVAPARELSILVGAIAGTTVLAEGHRRRRLLAAGAVFAGIVALASG